MTRSSKKSTSNLDISSKKITKTIEPFMTELPSEVLLKYATTQDLLNQFFLQRKLANLIGRALKARFGGGGGSPIYEAYEAGLLDKTARDMTIQVVDLYSDLFGLIQTSWIFIRRELDKLEKQGIAENIPESETHYFLLLLQEMQDIQFMQYVNGYEFKRISFEEKLKHLEIFFRSPNLSSSPSLTDLVKKERREVGFYFWFALDTVIKYSKKDRTLKDKLTKINNSLSKLSSSLLLTMYIERSPNSLQIKSLKTHRWDKGERFMGTSGGGWKKEPLQNFT